MIRPLTLDFGRTQKSTARSFAIAATSKVSGIQAIALQPSTEGTKE